MEGNAKPGPGPGLEEFQIGGTSFTDIMMQLWDAFPNSTEEQPTTTVDMSAIKQEPEQEGESNGTSSMDTSNSAIALNMAPSTSRTRATKSKRSKSKDDKTCGVCGDKALGCNFDAISCESCKAFFRRNALKAKKTKCLFNGDCRIDVNTRRFCPHCRLQKCFAIGMKKDLILGDDEKKKRLDKVKNNRQRKGKGKDANDNNALSDSDPMSPNSTTPISSPSHSNSLVVSPVMMNGPLTPGNPATPSTISAPGTPVAPMSPETFTFHEQSDQPSSFSQAQVQPNDNTGNLLSMQNCRGPFISSNLLQVALTDQNLIRKLTPEETAILTELQQVYELSFIVDLEPLIHINHADPNLNQLVNQSSITVLRIIKFAKRLEEFTKLPQECQIGILKWTWIHILMLRSISLYDIDRDVWVTPKGKIPSGILKNATGFVQLHHELVTFSKAFKTIIQNDLPIVIMLSAIILFSPEGPHVIFRDVVSNIQDKYLLLLKHYLEARYSYSRAADMYPQLIYKIKELKELCEDQGKVLLHVDPSEIEPIMLEILDLK